METWDRLLASLRAADRVEVLPPASETEVAAFETQHDLQLPDDFRRFLLGGAGGVWMDDEPTLFALADLAELVRADGIHPAAPFPYDREQAAALRDLLKEPRPDAGWPSHRPFVALQRSGVADGCLPLTDHGDGERCALVVAGPERGRMWRLGDIDMPEAAGLHPGHPASGAWDALTFADWLPLWASTFIGV